MAVVKTYHADTLRVVPTQIIHTSYSSICFLLSSSNSSALQFDLFFYHFQYVVTSSNNMCFLGMIFFNCSWRRSKFRYAFDILVFISPLFGSYDSEGEKIWDVGRWCIDATNEVRWVGGGGCLIQGVVVMVFKVRYVIMADWVFLNLILAFFIIFFSNYWWFLILIVFWILKYKRMYM